MPRLYLAQGQALASTYNRWRNYTPARAISRARSEYRGELGHTWEALYSPVSPNFPLVSIDSQLACEIGVTIDSNGAQPSKRQKGRSLLYNTFAFPPKQVRTPNTRSRLLLRILLRHRGRYSYEADISGGGPDVTRGVVCSLEFVPCLFLMTSSLTIVGPAGRSCTTFHNEGKRGLYRRMLLTLLGMSNFTLQFVTYE